METSEKEARALGCRRIDLDVFAEKLAVRLYERLGMHVEVEPCPPPPHEANGVGMYYRIVRDLD